MCTHENAYYKQFRFAKGEMIEYCNHCSEASSPTIADVYFNDRNPDSEHISDNMGNVYHLTSKNHKAMVMKQLGMREAGDRVRGAPVCPKPKSWHEGVRKAQQR